MSESPDPKHDERHDALLGELLEGRRDADEPELRELLAHCPRCRERWEERRRILAALGRAGALEREVLASAERASGAPGEARVDEWLARAVREAGARRVGRRPWLRIAAAAAVVAVAGLAWVAFAPEGREPRSTLGVGEGNAWPVGEVGEDGFDEFRWELGLPPGGYYVVHVVPLGPEGEELPEVRSERLPASRWTPPAEERARWTRIRWSVHSYRRANEGTHFGKIVGVEAVRE